MALITCPSCSKRISDKASTCQHCNTVLVGDPEKLRTQSRIKRIEQSAKLMNHSLIALIIFIAGLGYSGFYADTGETWDKWLAQGMTAVGFVWYIVLRVKIMIFKKERD